MTAAFFQPPPTYADVIIVDQRTKQASFNPIWLKWFTDLVGIVNASGGGGGVVQHNDTGGLQGGEANQYYHLTTSEHTAAQALIVVKDDLVTLAGEETALTTLAEEEPALSALAAEESTLSAIAAGTVGLAPSTPAGAAQTGRIYMQSGAPADANGNDGDFCWRSDGSAGAYLYHKESGVWTAIL